MHLTVKASQPGPRLEHGAFVEEALPFMEAVYRFALRLHRGRVNDAEDLVQETYLRAYASWHGFRRGTNCRSWLFTICRRAFLRGEDRASRRSERSASESNIDLDVLPPVSVFGNEVEDPEWTFFSRLVDSEVTAAVDGLPREFREVLVLSDLQDFTYSEISEALGIPLGTVRSRLYRGRRLLQRALYRYAVDSGHIAAKREGGEPE